MSCSKTYMCVTRPFGIFANSLVDPPQLNYPNLTSSFHDALPAFYWCNTSFIIAENVNNKLAACRFFLLSKIGAKVRKTLKHQNRPCCNVLFKPNNNIFYKLYVNINICLSEMKNLITNIDELWEKIQNTQFRNSNMLGLSRSVFRTLPHIQARGFCESS